MRTEPTMLHALALLENVVRDVFVGTRSATDLTTWSDVVPTAERTLENVDDVDVQE